jgi:hypothetical protein
MLCCLLAVAAAAVLVAMLDAQLNETQHGAVMRIFDGLGETFWERWEIELEPTLSQQAVRLTTRRALASIARRRVRRHCGAEMAS